MNSKTNTKRQDHLDYFRQDLRNFIKSSNASLKRAIERKSKKRGLAPWIKVEGSENE